MREEKTVFFVVVATLAGHTIVFCQHFFKKISFKFCANLSWNPDWCCKFEAKKVVAATSTWLSLCTFVWLLLVALAAKSRLC